MKAKTLGELITEVCGRDICVGCPIAKQHNCDSLGKLVKFEDVEELEQKVKNLETDRDNLLKSLHTCTQNLNSYAKESVELKQKLQQFKRSLEIQLDILKSKPHHSETETQLEIILNEFEEKFEELLKEV
jgi:predicted RNase H-like nuclease (RuvC/YqgF family)